MEHHSIETAGEENDVCVLAVMKQISNVEAQTLNHRIQKPKVDVFLKHVLIRTRHTKYCAMQMMADMLTIDYYRLRLMLSFLQRNLLTDPYHFGSVIFKIWSENGQWPAVISSSALLTYL